MLLTGGEAIVLDGAGEFWKMHGRNIGQAVIVMVLAWLTIERALGWLPKKSWATGIKRLLSLALGVFGLILLEEMAGGIVEAAHAAASLP